MSYGEQVAWVARCLDNPEAARVALDSVKCFIKDFDEVYQSNRPCETAAKDFYNAMIANYVTEFGFDIRRD